MSMVLSAQNRQTFRRPMPRRRKPRPSPLPRRSPRSRSLFIRESPRPCPRTPLRPRTPPRARDVAGLAVAAPGARSPPDAPTRSVGGAVLLGDQVGELADAPVLHLAHRAALVLDQLLHPLGDLLRARLPRVGV